MDTTSLPDWCDELKRRYVRGEACQFVLHGNVHDLILHDGKLHGLVDFLGNVLLASRATSSPITTCPRACAS